MVPAAAVAEFIARRRKTLSATELDRLLYLCQGFALAWRGTPLFAEPIQARSEGPAVEGAATRAVRGQSKVELSDEEATIVDAVVDFFSARDGAWLAALAQRGPWRTTYRPDSPPAVIPLHVLTSYFLAIAPTPADLSAALERGLDIIVDTPLDELDSLLSAVASPDTELEQWLKQPSDVSENHSGGADSRQA